MAYSELSDSAYTRLRRQLLRNRGGDLQKEFLMGVRDSVAFVEFFEKVPKIGTADPPLIPYPMTENEYREPPSDTERSLFAAWSLLTPSIACRSTFWANVTLSHIRSERIQAAYLAANGGNVASGAERIDVVLRDNSERADQHVDSCVRTILRRIGGLPEIRGNRSVFVDCPFARAWWRERMVAQAGGDDDEQLAQQVRYVLRINQTYWEKLVDRIVFRNSTFGSANIRSAFLRSLAQVTHSNPNSSLLSHPGLQRLCRRAAAYQGNLELSVLDDSELDAIMHDIFNHAI